MDSELQKVDEEDDYMSDAFLTTTGDVRPGLVFQRTTKRKYELDQKRETMNKKSYVKPTKLLEKEQREDGLSKAIDSSNKGFALLQKMGYKPGTSLGKSGTGRTEPVPLNIKVDRSGLGREELLKQKRKEVADMRLKLYERRCRLLDSKRDDFMEHQRNKMLEKQLNRDLYSSQKSCQQLDQVMGLVEPVEAWFWPNTSPEKSDSDEESDESENEEKVELEVSEKLEILTSYLRSTHLFCVWCGTSYKDKEDMLNCPGDKADDH